MKSCNRIRVLHLISGDLWAGAEAQAFTLISWLKRNSEFELFSIVFNQGRLSQELIHLGIPVYIFDENKYNSFSLFFKVREVLSQENVQILHTHRYKENVIGSLAAQFCGRPYLVKTVHGLPEPFKGIKKIKAKLYGFLDRGVTRLFFHKVICVSHQIGQRLKKEYRNSILVCVHNCVDVEKIKVDKPKVETKKELGINPDSPVIGTAGRLVPVKGLDYFLKATRILQPEVPDLKVLIVGEGPERVRLQNLASEWGLDSHVIFTGHREDVLSLISSMDIFVLPSLSEGIPMALLETLALGVPVVATNVGGIPEILQDEQTGILVPPRNERALADVCQYLLEHKGKAELIGAKGKELVQQNFSAETMAKKVASIYRSLIS